MHTASRVHSQIKYVMQTASCVVKSLYFVYTHAGRVHYILNLTMHTADCVCVCVCIVKPSM